MSGPAYRFTCVKVGRNNWFGLRTNLTMRDDDTWYSANQVAGRWLIITGIGTGLSSAGGILAGMNEVESATLVAGGMLTGISICVFASLAEQRRVIEERDPAVLNDADASHGV
ncbi:MAG: SdpI family protein [Planctomycetaceae bacterium]|nr:SdpI family protein [Planctomycetaceae bacterium]